MIDLKSMRIITMHVVIPDKDPIMTLLERRAVRRGFPSDRKKLRKKLPAMARSLLKERLGELETNGDPFAMKSGSAGG
jgi:hypothetical protein